MILDKQLELSNAQAVTASASSTNVIDLGPGGPHGYSGPADSDPIPIHLNIDTTFTAGGAATLTIQVRSSAAAAMTSPVIHSQSTAIPVASLTAGAKVPFLPNIPVNALRYVDLNYVVATGPMTAGAISARGTTARQLNV